MAAWRSGQPQRFESLAPPRNMLRDVCAFHALACAHGHTAYLHKNGLYECTVCGRAFREAVNAYSDREQKKRSYRLIDAARPSLPEDSALPEGCRFSFQDRPIPRTGLAECAYLRHMQEAAFSYSLAGSDFAVNPLHVGIAAGTAQAVQTIGNSLAWSSSPPTSQRSLRP